MNVTVSHIRSTLQECYPPREAVKCLVRVILTITWAKI